MTFFLLYWKQLLVAGLILVLFGYGQTMRSQRDSLRVEYSDYRREVAKAAQLAAEHALKVTIANEEKREKADVDNLRLRSDLAVLTKRLRDARASSSFVPPAASCPDRPSSAAFDRTLLERALQQLDGEVSGLLEEGDRAVIDLDTAKRWAQDR